MSKLFTPLAFGRTTLQNRIAMAPLTRCRSDTSHIPSDLMAEHYSQRASAGLLIAEATVMAENISAYYTEPGIYTDEQAKAWKKTTDLVHAAGAKMFLQMYHPGRISVPHYNGGVESVAPSAVASESKFHDAISHKRLDNAVPRALTDEEAQAIVQKFAEGAARAVDIGGFDGVEIHGANGYLINQFLTPVANKRTEGRYAGISFPTRAQFALDVVDAVAKQIGVDRTGIRISPLVGFQEAKFEDPDKDTEYLSKQLSDRNILYIHVVRRDLFNPQASGDSTPIVRANFKNVVITNGGYERQESEEVIDKGGADAVAIGVPMLANPDLVRRFQEKREERNAPDMKLFYAPGPNGYTDYPFLS